ncbi:P-loop NTPase family protein [Cobetia marina]|uniref:hypothetical protein n=1 Tax=Cobetia marina TaxID=28258 RepID=UPI0038517490
MDSIHEELAVKLVDLMASYKDLSDSISDMSLPTGTVDLFLRLNNIFDDIDSSNNIDHLDSNNLIKISKRASVYALKIGNDLTKLDDISNDVKNKISHLVDHSKDLSTYIKETGLDRLKLGEAIDENKIGVAINDDLFKKNGVVNNIYQRDLNLKLRDFSSKLDDAVADQENMFKKVSSSASKLEDKVNEHIVNASGLYDEGKDYLNKKNEEINELLGIISEKSLISGFQKSAVSERNSADWLRGLSVLLMLAMVAVVAYTFWETVNSTFDWKVSVFRLLLVTVLSIPSAYLARESTKHRMQQYIYQQTSLELQALPLYISSLPDEFQYIIKADAASKLFAGGGKLKDSEESFPINTQELILKVLDIVERKGNNSK